jgi:hypothetical protein
MKCSLNKGGLAFKPDILLDVILESRFSAIVLAAKGL